MKRKPKDKIEREQICGEVMDIFCDRKINKLNLQLELEDGSPLIVLQNWTGNKCVDLVHLHLKEAVELKAVIDKLVLDYQLYYIDTKECECNGN